MSLLGNIFWFKAKKAVAPFILTFHRILKDATKEPFPIQPGMYVSIENFEETIVYLKENFSVIRLEDLLDGTYNGKPLNNHCAITFDDGWVDNYTNAFPILQQYGVPATFFLTTAFIGTNRWFWFDEVAFFLQKHEKSNQLKVFSKEFIPNNIIKAICRRRQCVEDKVTEIVYELKNKVSMDDRGQLMDDIILLNRRFGEQVKVMMDWDQVKSMESSGIANFCSHSHSHERLDLCSSEYVLVDINESLLELSRHVNGRVNRVFCYPSGNCSAGTKSVLQNLGFDYAVTTERGFVQSDNCYSIKRMGIHNDMSKKLPRYLR